MVTKWQFIVGCAYIGSMIQWHAHFVAGRAGFVDALLTTIIGGCLVFTATRK